MYLLDTPPSCERHDTVVHNMKSWEMWKLLTEYEEDGVKVVDEFWEEVPPSHISRCPAILWVRVIHWLAQQVVLPSKPEATSFAENPQAQKGLEEVVGYHDILDVIWRSIFHEPRPSNPYDIVVNCTESKHWPRGGHEQPVINPAHIGFKNIPNPCWLECIRMFEAQVLADSV